MSEIGSGGGSDYPGALDTGAVPETAADFARVEWATDVEAAIVSIQAELGVDPAGTYSTVVARLDAILTVGLFENRPAPAAGVIGFYYSTDSDFLEFSNGVQWRPVMMG